MTVRVDKDTCIGCGACAAACPETFVINQNEGKAEVINSEDTDCARGAAENCPVQAIILE